MKRAALLWAAIVVPVWIVMVLCTHWEPVMRDGWGHFSWHKTFGTSLATVWDFAKGSYVHNNPRFGQVLTYLVFTPGPWHEMFTPLAELSLFYLLAALVLGRWPSVRRTDDALLFATIIAMIVVCAPLFGPMLFYRPYTGNYLFGLVLTLAFLVPYRFAIEGSRGRWWLVLPVLVLGAAAGLSNEHTGPTALALALVAIAVCWRRGARPTVWMIAGIIGLAAGGLALFYAPGQAIRYNSLATHESMLGRIVERGLSGNVKIISTLVAYLLPLLAWAALGIVARVRAKREPITRVQAWVLVALGAASLAIVLTLLASPKQGPRLLFASVAFACAATAGWVIAQLGPLERKLAAIAAAAILVFAGWRCLHAYSALGPEFAARLDALEHAPPNSVLQLPRYTIRHSRWSLADDLDNEDIRNHVAFSFQLALIQMTGDNLETTAPADDP